MSTNEIRNEPRVCFAVYLVRVKVRGCLRLANLWRMPWVSRSHQKCSKSSCGVQRVLSNKLRTV